MSIKKTITFNRLPPLSFASNETTAIHHHHFSENPSKQTVDFPQCFPSTFFSSQAFQPHLPMSLNLSLIQTRLRDCQKRENFSSNLMTEKQIN
jgi:hypothetical protein